MKIFVRLLWVNLFLALTPFAAQAAIGINADTFSIPADGILVVEPDGVLANDTMNDVDNSPQFVLDIAKNHTITVVTPPTEGTLKCGTAVNTICADGSFNFTVSPTTFSGVDSFTYKLEVDVGLSTYEFAEATVFLKACSTTGTETICWTEGSFFDALAETEDPQNPFHVKHEGFEGAAWNNYRSYQDANLNWVYNQATTITSKGIGWSSNHPATNFVSTSTGAAFTGSYGIFDPEHGYATNTSIGECQALETANNGVVPPECLPYDGVSGTSTTLLYAAGGYIKGSNSAANIEIITDGGLPNNIGKLVTPAHQFYGVINTVGFNSFQFRDIDGKTGQPLFIFGDDFYLVTRNAADANQAPVIAAVADQTVAAGSLFQIDIPVSDPDDDAVASVLSGVPTTGTGRARLIENNGSVRIRWITPSTAVGIYTVSITVTDNGYPKLSQALNFQLTVTPPPPTLNLPGNITAEATSASGATVTYASSATDVTDGNLASGCTPASGSTFALGTTTVNCSVTNSSSQTTTGSFTVLVRDTTAPSVTAPPSIVREATAAATAVTLDSGNVAAAFDLVSGALTALPDKTGPFSVGIHTITWSATDGKGNIGQATQTVTINDTSAPTIAVLPNLTEEATGPNGAAVTYAVTGTDTVDGTINGVCTPTSGSTFGLVTTTVNCTVTDAKGNVTSGSFTVDVVDTTPPTVTAPVDITIEATGATTAVNLGTASASDLVSGTLIPTASDLGPFAVGQHTITWSATDSANLTATAIQLVTVTDTGAPVLTLPNPITVEATGTTGAIVNYTATANDIVDGVLSSGCVPISGSTFAVGTTAVNCSVTDSANLTTSGSFNIKVVDTTAPTVTAPANITLEATGATTAVNLGSASASDLVDGSITPTASNTGPFAVGIHTITWSATDLANNTGTATQTVTITDTGAPALSLPGNLSVEASSAAGALVNYVATASDTVDGSLTPVCTPISGSTFALGTTVVNCSVTDSANLTTSAGFNVTVEDTTAPVVSSPINISKEATGVTTAVSLGSASANDLVSGVITPTASSSGPFTVGAHTITWSATDLANNTGTATQTVTITDTVAPTLNLPANISQGATSTAGAVVNYTVTANDIAEGVVAASCSPVSGSSFTLGTTTVNCSASDSANNSTAGSFNVTITDTGAPTLSLPANISIEASASTGAIVTYSATASDVIDGPLAANCLPASGNTFALGDHVVNCSAQDLQGNTSNGSFIVSVVDTTTPVVTAPANVNTEATGATTSVTLGIATASDLVSGTLTPVASNSGPFSVGVHTITWSATDAANNTGTATQIVTITDSTAPVLSMPTGITQEATSAAGAVVNYSVSANDIVDGAMTASCLPVSGSTFALGITAVSCSVTDAAKLTTTGGFNVTIVDTQAPTVTAPANISMEASGTTTVVALGTATATDIVSGVLPATADNTGPFVVGVHTITWSATDNANNTGSATQIVTITDIGSPTLSLPANITAEATSASGVLVSYTVTASDVVDGALTASCTPLSGTTFALGDTIVNCSATDSSNQTTSGSFSVTVVDTTGPALTLPADIGVNSTSTTGTTASYTASATDAVDGPIAPNCTPVSGSIFALGTTVVNCSATDGANNTTAGSFNVTVIDASVNHAPIANAGSPQTVSAGSPVTLNGSASSDPDGDVITYQWTLVSKPQGSLIDVAQATMPIASFNPDKSGVYEAQLIVTDSNNTRSLASRVTITVVNNAPVANAGTDRSVVVGDSVILDGILSSDANGDNLTYQWSLTLPTGSTAALAQATSVKPQFTADVAGIYTAQLIVNDGTIDSAVDTVFITALAPVDVAPTITVPADISVDSTGYLTPVNLGVATATDPEDGALQPTADNSGPFTTGRHVITWSVTDSGNNTVTATQTVDVLPMVNFQLDQQSEIGQASVQIALTMNGVAPAYPVTIDYNWTINGIIAGSDQVTISAAKSGVIDYQLPTTLVATDTITFSLVSVQNAVAGFNDTHTITLIDSNVAPIVEIEVTQNGKPTKNLHTNDGAVTVTANIHDANQGDTHTLDWSTTDNNLTVPATGSVKTFDIDPSNLLDGNYKIGIKVVDSGALEAENEIYVSIKTQDFNPPAGTDSDHDGIDDDLEGDYDDDNDGVPNYLDAIDGQPELLQMQVGQSNRSVLATQSGLSLRLGKIAQLSEKYAANLTAAELAQFANLGRVTDALDPNDSDFTAGDGYLDFTINGLTTPGQSVKLVIPLLSPIPDQAVYRKYSPDTGWSNFIEDAANGLSSAPGADGVCPSPGSSDYLPGLEPGEYCIQMLIEDGGPNDSDLLSNGVITDPGGVAVAKAATTPTKTTPATSGGSGGGGGGAIDLQLLLSIMMLLTLATGIQAWTTRNKMTVKRHRGNKPQG